MTAPIPLNDAPTAGVPLPGNPIDDTAASDLATHRQMYEWARHLFPICRSITGGGVRETLRFLKGMIPEIQIHEVPSGTSCFDWTVPDEWNIYGAYLDDDAGTRILDFRENNLHVVGYSEPIDRYLSLNDLLPRLYSLEDNPTAIPYITRYYSRGWGFCLPHTVKASLKQCQYHAVIDSSLAPGALTYADLVVTGESKDEVLLSTYVCHPSMANNELSGIVLTLALARWIVNQPKLRYTYRFVWVPETIGSIVYLSKHLRHMKEHTKAGFVVTCVGDARAYSYLASRHGNTLSDRVARHVLKHATPAYTTYSFLERGSDERQYCYPGVDLPVASVMRSKYGTYPEYHTSLDNLDVISPEGLGGAFEVYRQMITLLEANYVYRATTLCEPQLGKRNLYPDVSQKENWDNVIHIVNLLSYADGSRDFIDICETIDLPFKKGLSILRDLSRESLICKVTEPTVPSV
jgi:aminopeptidase-like protein